METNIFNTITAVQEEYMEKGKHPDSIVMNRKTYEDLLTELEYMMINTMIPNYKEVSNVGGLVSTVCGMKIIVSPMIPEDKIVFELGEDKLETSRWVTLDDISIPKFSRFAKKRMIRLD